jgi:hypothetical protein
LDAELDRGVKLKIILQRPTILLESDKLPLLPGTCAVIGHFCFCCLLKCEFGASKCKNELLLVGLLPVLLLRAAGPTGTACELGLTALLLLACFGGRVGRTPAYLGDALLIISAKVRCAHKKLARQLALSSRIALLYGIIIRSRI